MGGGSALILSQQTGCLLGGGGGGGQSRYVHREGLHRGGGVRADTRLPLAMSCDTPSTVPLRR